MEQNRRAHFAFPHFIILFLPSLIFRLNCINRPGIFDVSLKVFLFRYLSTVMVLNDFVKVVKFVYYLIDLRFSVVVLPQIMVQLLAFELRFDLFVVLLGFPLVGIKVLFVISRPLIFLGQIKGFPIIDMTFILAILIILHHIRPHHAVLIYICSNVHMIHSNWAGWLALSTVRDFIQFQA